MRITAVVVVYKEEALIERCLSNLKGAVDEVIVVHDGKPVDRTMEIAARYTKRLFIRPRKGFCEPHFNFGFRQAKGDWILRIDADELLSGELKAVLRNLAKDTGYDGYAFKWGFYSTEGKFLFEHKFCFFRKESLLPFKGLIHETMRVRGKIKNIDMELVHRPILNYFSWEYFKNKSVRYAKIHAGQLAKEAKRPAVFYLLKSVLWFFVYLAVPLFKGYLAKGYMGLKMIIQSGLYNFLIWYYVFKIKLTGHD